MKRPPYGFRECLEVLAARGPVRILKIGKRWVTAVEGSTEDEGKWLAYGEGESPLDSIEKAIRNLGEG